MMRAAHLHHGDPSTWNGGDFDLSTTPETLERIVLRALALNIQEWFPWLLNVLGPEHSNVVLEELSLDLPLTFCVHNIPDGVYWQRRAISRWPSPDQGVCDVSEHGHSWLRLYLERHVEQLLERSLPADSNSELPVALKAELRDAAPHVRRLKLREMQPGPEVAGHLLLGPVLAVLTEVEQLHIRCGPKKSRLQFTWTKFTFTKTDALSLQQGLFYCQGLLKLSLTRSHLTNTVLGFLFKINEEEEILPNNTKEHACIHMAVEFCSHNSPGGRCEFHLSSSVLFPPAMSLYLSGLQQPREKWLSGNHKAVREGSSDEDEITPPPPKIALAINFLCPHLSELNLSHNKLKDDAMEILVEFILCHPHLKTLSLVNNKFGAVGAKFLSTALSNETCGLCDLNLTLNDLGEEGGIALARSSVRLQVLTLAGCTLGIESANSFIEELSKPNCQLKKLDLSNNQLDEEAGHQFLTCLRENNFLLRHLDLRMTDISDTCRRQINTELISRIKLT